VRWGTAAWAIIKDVVLTGTGVWILITQALSQHPSDPLLVVAMGLCAPAIYDHAKSLVSGTPPPREPPGGEASGGTSPSSGSALPSSSSASSSSEPDSHA
jgi:hypothetical protein